MSDDAIQEAIEIPKPISTGIAGMDSLFGGGLSKGTALLLIAPPIIEARLFTLEFLYRATANSEAAMCLTTDDSPENLKIKAVPYGWNFTKPEEKNSFKWIDTYSINANKDLKSTSAIKRVGGPVALSDMAIAISDFQISFYRQQFQHFKFIFDSLSTLLMYSNPDTVYYFLQSVVPKIKNSGGIGFFTLSSGMHDPRIEMTLRHLMDGTITIDEQLNLKILSFPVPIERKEAKLVFSKQGFSVQ